MSWNFDEPVRREGTCSVKYDLRKEIFGNPEVIPMWVADMDFKTPDFIISALRKRLDHEVLGYSFRSPEYYSSLMSWVKRRHNWEIEKEWICFSPGVVPALNFCTLAFTDPGDSIIVQPPVYFPFFTAAESHGRRLIYNQLKELDGKWTMDIESLASQIDSSTRMIFISNPHNPVGRVWSAKELEELADVCIKYGIVMISDEIHSDLVMPGHRHVPMASVSRDISESTVTLMAPSKTFNLAGLATSSAIISNPELRKKYNTIVDRLHIGNGNIFGNEASVAAYENGAEWLDSLIEYILGNIKLVNSFCGEKIPEIIPVIPEATYMIWLDCRKLNLPGKELSKFFINEAGTGMNEGSVFGPGGEGFMRMNVATTRETVRKALGQFEKAVSKLR
jgi:cystathionine beta-lyase